MTPNWGDPAQMTEQQRREGHEGLRMTMDNDSRALADASGGVSDHRRLVAFVYLVLRDNMTFGEMARVRRDMGNLTGESRETLRFASQVGVLEDYAARLTSEPFQERVIDWVALVLRHSTHPENIPALIDMLPADDDTETLFSNGWAANYAQYLVDKLLNGSA